MIIDTTFGQIISDVPVSSSQLDPVLRGLQWCDELASESTVWNRKRDGKSVVLKRTIGRTSLTLHPLEAAKNDLRIRSVICHPGHIPLEVNGKRVCVVPNNHRKDDLNVDTTASFILLFSQKGLPPHEATPQTVKATLYARLFPREIASKLIHGSGNDSLQIWWTFVSTVSSPSEAVEFFDKLPIELQEAVFPILEHVKYPSASRDIQDRILSNINDERPASHLLWALCGLLQRSFTAHQTMIRTLSEHPFDSVLLHVASHLQCESVDEARGVLLPLLHRLGERFPSEGWRSLLEFDELVDELCAIGTAILGDIDQGSTYLDTMIVLSEHIDVDCHVQSFLKRSNCETSRKKALMAAKTYEVWMEDYLTSLQTPLSNSLVVAALQAAKSNPKVDVLTVCEKILDGASGWAFKHVMESLSGVGSDRHFAILRKAVHHKQRFVVRCALHHLSEFASHEGFVPLLEDLMQESRHSISSECRQLLAMAR